GFAGERLLVDFAGEGRLAAASSAVRTPSSHSRGAAGGAFSWTGGEVVAFCGGVLGRRTSSACRTLSIQSRGRPAVGVGGTSGAGCFGGTVGETGAVGCFLPAGRAARKRSASRTLSSQSIGMPAGDDPSAAGCGAFGAGLARGNCLRSPFPPLSTQLMVSVLDEGLTPTTGAFPAALTRVPGTTNRLPQPRHGPCQAAMFSGKSPLCPQ